MNDWREISRDCETVRRFDMPGGRALVFLKRRDGLFCFVGLRWWEPWDEGEGPLDDGYWGVELASGVFATQALAETEAFSSGFWKSAQPD